MTRRFGTWIRSDREGQTLAIVAVMLVGLLAVMALAIDLGMAYTGRAEAQRVADSAALAGASAFLDFVDPLDAVGDAHDRAEEYAELNYVRGRTVVAEVPEVRVWVIPDSQRVRVRIQRTGLPTWFARFLGRTEMTVAAIATAHAAAAGSTECAAPFAVPDIWHETTQDTLNVNGIEPWNRRMDFDAVDPLYKGLPANNPNEFWSYDPKADGTGDRYVPYHTIRDYNDQLVYDRFGTPLTGDPNNATGYGSNWRNEKGSAGPEDNGLRILLYPPQHVSNDQLDNWWNFWTTDDGSSSYDDARKMLTSGECIDIDGITGVGGTIKRVTGNRAVVVDDWYKLIDAHDPHLRWNDDLGWPYDPNKEGDPVAVTSSRRIVSVPLVHPDVLLMGNAERGVRVVDIATMFIEDPRLPENQGGYGAKQGDKNFTPLTGRIIHRGTGTLGPTEGKFERVLQLIK
jgi:hypothetical protein